MEKPRNPLFGSAIDRKKYIAQNIGQFYTKQFQQKNITQRVTAISQLDIDCDTKIDGVDYCYNCLLNSDYYQKLQMN